MALDSINEVRQNGISGIQMATGERTEQFNPILQFADKNNSNGIGDNEPSEAKIKTKMFVDNIMSKLDTSKSKGSHEDIKDWLEDLVKVAQQLNGVQKNNLKPQGTPKQNNTFERRLRQDKNQMNQYAEFIGSSISVVQDSKTGIYKLCVNNKLYDIPERKVELKTVNTDFGDEFVPEIVD